MNVVALCFLNEALTLCNGFAVTEALWRGGIILSRLKLTLHPPKTQVVDIGDGQQGFDFRFGKWVARIQPLNATSTAEEGRPQPSAAENVAPRRPRLRLASATCEITAPKSPGGASSPGWPQVLA